MSCVRTVGTWLGLATLMGVGLFVLLSALATSQCVTQKGVTATTSEELKAIYGRAKCEYNFGFGMVTSHYDGHMEDGYMMGQGRYEADRWVYVGGFWENDRHGKGVMTTPGGPTLDGSWREGDMFGFGSMQIPDKVPEVNYMSALTYFPVRGAKYDGTWELGVPYGSGEIRLGDGTAGYKGEFEAAFPSAVGSLVTTDGAAYRTEVIEANLTIGRVVVTALSPVVGYTLNCTLSAALNMPSVDVTVGGNNDFDYESLGKGMKPPKKSAPMPCDAPECKSLADTFSRILHFSNVVVHHRREMHRVMDYTWYVDERREAARELEEKGVNGKGVSGGGLHVQGKGGGSEGSKEL